MTGKGFLINLKPRVLQWARERNGISQEELAKKMRVKPVVVSHWESSGDIKNTHLDKLADCTHTPLGQLFLDEPLEDNLPIPDFRIRQRDSLSHPSPNLLETVYLMQRRQLWMRDELIEAGAKPLEFVGSCKLDFTPTQIAEVMRKTLQLQEEWASHESTWTDALRSLRNHAEQSGVLVVFNGVVGNNTHRKLDRNEFLGFALVDEYAPVVFVNGADHKAAQMFTLAHELAHIFVGKTGVTRHMRLRPTNHDTEQVCDKAAAEFLVPGGKIKDFWNIGAPVDDLCRSIASKFKVSLLVAARRALDQDLITQDAFLDFYDAYRMKEWQDTQQSESDGGNFWFTQRWRLGREFGSAIVRAVKEGRLSYREAYRLTGLSGKSFKKMPTKMDLEL